MWAQQLAAEDRPRVSGFGFASLLLRFGSLSGDLDDWCGKRDACTQLCEAVGPIALSHCIGGLKASCRFVALNG